MVRAREIEQSLVILHQVLAALPDTPLVALLPDRLPASTGALGWVEAGEGRAPIGLRRTTAVISRVKITDPSFLNWPGLVQAVPGNIIPDFPVINKSFNLSYSGNDCQRAHTCSILINSLKTGVITEAEPLGMPASFGFPVIDFSRCTACDECARACPTGAISTTLAGADKKIVTLSAAACIQCRACDGMSGAGRQRLARCRGGRLHRQQLARSASFDIDPATGRGTLVQVEAHQAPPFTNQPIDCASGSAVGSGARFMCARWTREAATRARWRSRRRRTQSTTWSASEFTWSPVRGMPTAARHRSRDAEHGDRAAKDL